MARVLVVVFPGELKHEGTKRTKRTKTHEEFGKMLIQQLADCAGMLVAGSREACCAPSVRLRGLRAFVLQLARRRSRASGFSGQNSWRPD